MELKLKKIILFGCGEIGHITYDIMKDNSIFPYKVIDSNDAKKGCLFAEDLLITGLDAIECYDTEDFVFVITIGRENYIEAKDQIEGIIQAATIVGYQMFINMILKDRYSLCEGKWNLNYETSVDGWLNNFMEEIPYHWNDMKSFRDVDRDRISEDERLKDISIKENSIMLDVGSGGTLLYSDRMNGVKMNYIPLDALADAYAYGQKQYGYKTPQRIRFALAEHLTLFFEENYADIIIFENSLDHTIDPFRGIIEAFRILKKEGVILLRHHAMEGLYGHAHGLHRWDLFMNTSGEFVIAEAGTDNVINISHVFGDAAEVEVYESLDTELDLCEVCVSIKKKENLDDDILQQYDNAFETGILLKKLMNEIIFSDISHDK